jgi:dTDP-4-amino-4,6-dideoxygalactose transaminase
MYALKKTMTSETLNPVLGKILDFNPTEALDGLSPRDMPQTDRVNLSNLQACIALESLKRIDLIVKKRRTLARAMREGLTGTGVELASEPAGALHSYGRMPLRISGMGKRELSMRLLKDGIETAMNYPYICPETEYFRGKYSQSGFRNARIAARETLMLPMHTKLNDGDVERIVYSVRRIVRSRL